VVLDHQQLVDRRARCRPAPIACLTADGGVHHHGVGHGRKNGAKAVLAVQTRIDEIDRDLDGAPAKAPRKQRLDQSKDTIEGEEQAGPWLLLMRPAGEAAQGPRRRGEEFVDADVPRVSRAGLEGAQHEKRHDHRARPIGNLRKVDGKPARGEDDLHRHPRNRAPGNDAIQRQENPREDVAGARSALGEQRFARPAHVGCVRGFPDHLQGEVGLDGGADIQIATVKQGPAAVGSLGAAQIGADLRLQRQIRCFT